MDRSYGKCVVREIPVTKKKPATAVKVTAGSSDGMGQVCKRIGCCCRLNHNSKEIIKGCSSKCISISKANSEKKVCSKTESRRVRTEPEIQVFCASGSHSSRLKSRNIGIKEGNILRDHNFVSNNVRKKRLTQGESGSSDNAKKVIGVSTNEGRSSRTSGVSSVRARKPLNLEASKESINQQSSSVIANMPETQGLSLNGDHSSSDAFKPEIQELRASGSHNRKLKSRDNEIRKGNILRDQNIESNNGRTKRLTQWCVSYPRNSRNVTSSRTNGVSAARDRQQLTLQASKGSIIQQSSCVITSMPQTRGLRLNGYHSTNDVSKTGIQKLCASGRLTRGKSGSSGNCKKIMGVLTNEGLVSDPRNSRNDTSSRTNGVSLVNARKPLKLEALKGTTSLQSSSVINNMPQTRGSSLNGDHTTNDASKSEIQKPCASGSRSSKLNSRNTEIKERNILRDRNIVTNNDRKKRWTHGGICSSGKCNKNIGLSTDKGRVSDPSNSRNVKSSRTNGVSSVRERKPLKLEASKGSINQQSGSVITNIPRSLSINGNHSTSVASKPEIKKNCAAGSHNSTLKSRNTEKNILRDRNVVSNNDSKKILTQGESSSSAKGKKIIGVSTYNGRVSDPRNSRKFRSSKTSGVSSVRARNPLKLAASKGSPNQQSSGVITNMPETRELSLNGDHSTSEGSTNGATVGSVNDSGRAHFNLDGIADVLLALDRYQHDEELTYAQLLQLSLYFGGLNIYDQHRDMRMDIDNMSYEELLALEETMGTVSTALSEEELSICIKTSVYDESSQLEDSQCSICQEEFVRGDEVGRLECGHGYHSPCINQWLGLKNWCPICKASPTPA